MAKKMLFSMVTEDYSVIPSTCLCADHYEKRGLIAPPLGATGEWRDVPKSDDRVRCIWCGYSNQTGREPLTIVERAAVLDSPNLCPRCKSDQLDAHGADRQANDDVYYRITCTDCEAEWVEVYRLADITNVK